MGGTQTTGMGSPIGQTNQGPVVKKSVPDRMKDSIHAMSVRMKNMGAKVVDGTKRLFSRGNRSPN